MVKKTSPATTESLTGETTEQLVKRVKKDMLWVLLSAAVAISIGFTAGQLIKF